MVWKKRKEKKKEKEEKQVLDRIKETSSANRRTLQLDIDRVKEEIEATRAKRAAEAAIPENKMAPEDLVLFKRLKDGEIDENQEPETAAQARADKSPPEILNTPETQNTDDEEIELPSLSEIKAAADVPPKTVEKLEDEMVQEDLAEEEEAKHQRLDTNPPETKEPEPLAADAGTFEPVSEPDDETIKPIAAEIESTDSGGLVTVGPKVTRWQKILGAGRQRQIMIGLGALVAAVIIGALLWYTRGWREWTGNLVVFSIPVLVILTYVLEYFSQDRFWEDYRHIKFLRKENRADAVVLIPLVMFMGLISLYSYMSFGQAFVHYLRFVSIAALVWMGLIWLTRRVPPYRKKDD